MQTNLCFTKFILSARRMFVLLVSELQIVVHLKKQNLTKPTDKPSSDLRR